jgi:rubrerythrin
MKKDRDHHKATTKAGMTTQSHAQCVLPSTENTSVRFSAEYAWDQSTPAPEQQDAPTSDQPLDVWICSECGAESLDWMDFCPVCGSKKSASIEVQAPYVDVLACGPSQTSGYWECPECGSSNSALVPDFCPICGSSR